MTQSASAGVDRAHDVFALTRRLLATETPRFTGEHGVEVHTLVSADHVPLYLFAAKSLARCWPEVTPVVHDDGTLGPRDTARLRRHVPGVRVIGRAEADERVEALLGDRPTLAAVRRNNVRVLQLVDYFLLSEAPSVVGMDSDVVFLSRPHTLVEWAGTASGERPDFCYSPEFGWEPQGVHWIADRLPGTPYVPYMCCGFTAVDTARFFDADFLEHTLASLPREISFAPRYVTQMAYSLLGGRLGAERTRDLGEPYRSGRLAWLPAVEDRVICHYFASHERATAHDNLAEEAPLLARALTG
ncbi:hypothetical protein [Streptomyces sp. CRN 30]|uniref:hypothetical protein n=1 Tax=Streptomyces sp. CRN 30 TaxID=3075613 RepID=UPI002A82E4D1|nr:hypothetical protein [Streptomyces sp. CRN 30]